MLHYPRELNNSMKRFMLLVLILMELASGTANAQTKNAAAVSGDGAKPDGLGRGPFRLFSADVTSHFVGARMAQSTSTREDWR